MDLNRIAYRELRRSTCAVFLFNADPRDPSMNFQTAPLEVLGTGFLVADGMVLTNRHVAVKLEAAREKALLPENRRFLAFCEPQSAKFLSIKSISVTHMTFLTNAALDLAILYFSPPDEPFWKGLRPVTVAPFSAQPGDEVGVVGFPFGESYFERDEGDTERKRYRFGPVLQRGWVSGIAPFDESEVVDRLLLDVRTTVGMSGGPVFRPFDGTVIGIHFGGRGQIAAYAVPLSPEFLVDTIDFCERTQTSTTANWEQYGPVVVAKVRRAPRNA